MPQSIEICSWPWAARVCRCPEHVAPRPRPRRRPDVSGYFTFTLVSALATGTLVAGEIVRTRVPVGEWLAYAAQHPMGLISGFCVVVIAGLLAIGDV